MGSQTDELVLGQLTLKLAMGGAENLAVQIANAHAATGQPSHLISMAGAGEMSSRIQSGVRVHELDYRRESIRNPLKFLRSVIRGYRLLAGVVEDNGIEVLQTHLSDGNFWGLSLAMRRKCVVVATIHNNRFLGEESRNPLGRFLKRRIYRLIFRYCGAVVACSEEVERSIAEGLGINGKAAGRVFSVTNGVFQPEEQSRTMRADIRDRWGTGPGETLLVAAGRFTEAKNFACLLDAMAILRREGRTPRLVIGGEGELRSRLQAQIAQLGLGDQVFLPGNIPDLTSLMSAADCLVMPSRWEGLPLVLLEGMVRKLPVVGTRIKGIMGIVEEGVNGYLADVDDAEGLASGIRRIMTDPDAGRLMGQRNQQLIMREYSFDRLYRDLDRIFRTAGCPTRDGHRSNSLV